MFLLEDHLIDTDMLQMDGEEANKLYNDLKQRAIRHQQKKIRELKIKTVLNQEQFDQENDDEMINQQQHRGSETVASSKILEILQKSNTQDRLDFCNNLQNFIDNNLEHRNCDALMPGLDLLAKDTSEVKKSLLQ